MMPCMCVGIQCAFFLRSSKLERGCYQWWRSYREVCTVEINRIFFAFSVEWKKDSQRKQGLLPNCAMTHLSILFLFVWVCCLTPGVFWGIPKARGDYEFLGSLGKGGDCQFGTQFLFDGPIPEGSPGLNGHSIKPSWTEIAWLKSTGTSGLSIGASRLSTGDGSFVFTVSNWAYLGTVIRTIWTF